VKGPAVVVVEYWGFCVIGDTGGADAIGALPVISVTWDVPEFFGMNSGGIPYPHQFGGTDPDIADANKSVASLTCPSDVDGLVVISDDCALVIPNVLGGDVTSEPATAVVADGAVTDDDLGW
jgi:hypothetical protein